MYWYYDFIVDYDGFSYDSNDFDFDNDSLSNYDLSEIEKDAVHNMCTALCKKFDMSIVSNDGDYEYTFKSPEQLDINKVKSFINTASVWGEGTIEVYVPRKGYHVFTRSDDDYNSYEVTVESYISPDKYSFIESPYQDELRADYDMDEQFYKNTSDNTTLLEALNKLNNINY